MTASFSVRNSPKIVDLIPERRAYNELIPGYAAGQVQNEAEHQDTYGDENHTERE